MSLGEQVTAVIEQTGLGEPDASGRPREFPVGLIGSAYKAGPVFLKPLTRAIHERAPGARVSAVEMAPVGGSLLLAARAVGRSDAVSSPELTRLLDEALRAPSV